jgi:ArsR family transcriptional regulator
MNTIDVSLICKALGDSNRLQIVQLLTGGEMCACKLLEHFQITQPTLSHHMKILTECGLVGRRKEWKNTFYFLNCETMTAFRNFIGTLKCDRSGCNYNDTDLAGGKEKGQSCQKT